MEQVCRLMGVLVRQWMRQQSEMSEIEMVCMVVAYHQRRNAAAERSAKKRAVVE